MLVCGSISAPLDSETRPERSGAVSEPRAVALMRSGPPLASAERSASSGLTMESGAVPETVASRPGPAKGIVPEPVELEAAGAGDAGRVEPERLAPELTGGGQRERRESVRAQDGRVDALAAQVEGDGRVGDRPGRVAGAGDRAAQAAVAGDPVDERQREGLQVDRDVEVAGTERHRAPGLGGEAVLRADRGVEVQPVVGGLAGRLQRRPAAGRRCG